MVMRFAKKLFQWIVPYALYDLLQRYYKRMSGKDSSAFSNFINFLNESNSLQVLRVLDVGARNGLDGPMAKLRAVKNHYFEGIEPDLNEVQRLLDGKLFHKVQPCAVFNIVGEAPFFITKGRGASSILRPNPEKLKFLTHSTFFEVVECSSTSVTTLDTLYTKEPNFDFIKIDVQGGEFQVLEGGKRLISSALGLVLEAQFREFYEGQKLFPQIHEHCLKSGFRLLKLIQSPLGDGEFAEATDCVYIRDPEQITKKEEFYKCILFALTWDNVDYAEFLLRGYGKNFLDDVDLSFFSKLIGMQPKAYFQVAGFPANSTAPN